MTNLFWDYQALMYRTAYRITREHQSAEDLVQETCMSLIDHLDVVKRLDGNRLRSYHNRQYQRRRGKIRGGFLGKVRTALLLRPYRLYLV